MDTVFLALRVALSLGAVLGLLWMLQRRLTRNNRSNGTEKLVTVVTRQGIGQKASVVVVDSDGKRFLLGVTEHSVRVLHTSDLPTHGVASVTRLDTPVSTSFGLAMANATGRSTEPTTDEANDSYPAPVAMLRPRRDRGQHSLLGGSILSPTTWKQTAAAIRQGP